jgi:para-nitrobenzyl esterase
VQPASLSEDVPEVIGWEDCLSLNIWTPENQGDRLPVMVFLHGGGHVTGGSSERIGGTYVYDGALLAARGRAVVVTLNYRLGPLGFLAHPALSSESRYGGSGNYGHMDQITALEWLRRNLEAFGGDRALVTLFGESAGAHSIAVLLASPLARGLFARAVVQSGSPLTLPLRLAERTGVRMASTLGYRGDDVLTCLRAATPHEIHNALPTTWRFGHGGVGFAPNVDHYVLPAPMLELFRRGTYNRVPVIIGHNADEYASMIGLIFAKPVARESEYRDHVRRYFGKRAARRILAAYPSRDYDSQQDALIAIFTDAVFGAPARQMARALARHQPGQVWRYVWTHSVRRGPLRKFRAMHGLELFFLFHRFPPELGLRPTEAELRFSDTVIRYWTRFAAKGDPNGGHDFVWQPYDPNEDNHHRLASRINSGTQFRVKQFEFWDSQA